MNRQDYWLVIALTLSASFGNDKVKVTRRDHAKVTLSP